ncbi:RNA methyltransferase-like protein 1-like protein [Perkinsela sp. CCAP 1560/4]|nr:RNA methyltransferase-like protein 1-like protein [Perkinsela sp. CCAP 1560/4]|eukprot:KNH04071.1 RNA methyltransferase-like protein 1-like protein [Perkinsela sp. CCAP 1560/4]
MLPRFGRLLARHRDRRNLKDAVDQTAAVSDFGKHASNFRTVNQHARPSSGLDAFTRSGLPEDGGAHKEIPTTYSMYTKEKYSRMGHPMGNEVSAEARNVPICDESIKPEDESRQANPQGGAFGRSAAEETFARRSEETYLKGVFSSKSAEQLQKKARKLQAQSLCEDVLWTGVTLRDRSSEVATHLKNLRLQKHFRAKKKKVVLHGYKVILELARHQKVYPKLLISAVDHQQSSNKRRQSYIKKLESELKKGGDDAFFVTATNAVMDEIDPGNDGFIAEYDMPVESPKELLFASPQQFQNILVLDNITDGGLLGTMMRTAAVFGYDLVVFTNHCADIYEPSVLTAARGAHFQKMTKFVCLSDADGDDETELVNQMLEYHRAQPFLYSPQITSSPSIRSFSLPNSQRLMIDHSVAKAKFLKGEEVSSMEDPGGILTNRVVHPTRHSSFHRVASAIFISEDKTRSFIPKLTQRLRVPPSRILVEESGDFDPIPLTADFTQDTLETGENAWTGQSVSLLQPQRQSSSPTRQFLHYQSIDIAAPIILHSMRSAELTELLTANERDILDSTFESPQVVYSTRKPKDNIVGDEDIREYHHTKQTEKMEQRMRRYQMTDEERWEMKEMQRIKKGHKNFERFLVRNFDRHTPQVIEGNDPYLYNTSGMDAQNARQEARHERYPNFIQEKSKTHASTTREMVKSSSARGKPIFPSSYYRRPHIQKRGSL